MDREVLFEVSNLRKVFKTGTTWGKSLKVYALNGVTLKIYRGETLGVVGESGCGKSTLGKTIIRLLRPDGGRILFKGVDITNMSNRKLRPYRKDMQIIFQDPFSSLNPRIKIGKAIEEPLVVHALERDKKRRRERVFQLLREVGLREEDYFRYPHEFSGGQRQRIAIARALALNPDFVVADEAVSALDVSIQAQVLNLLMRLQKEYNLTYLFISHDLRVVARVSDRIAVLYLGQVMEIGTAEDIFLKPAHPYTHALLSSIPGEEKVPEYIKHVELKGDPPSPYFEPEGCPLADRCPFADDRCRKVKPVLEKIEGEHYVACHHPFLISKEVKDGSL